MNKLLLTKNELSFLVEAHSNPNFFNHLEGILNEGVFDKNANQGFKMTVEECNLKIDPRVSGILISDDDRAPRLLQRINDSIDRFLGRESILGWRKIVSFFKSIADMVGVVILGVGNMIFQVLKKIFKFISFGLFPPSGAFCRYISEMSVLLGNILGAIVALIFKKESPEDDDATIMRKIARLDPTGFLEKAYSFLAF